jgi:hypothetical protein
MNAGLRRTTISDTVVGWAGIALGVTLVILALIPALPRSGSRSDALPAPVSLSQARREPAVASPERISIPAIKLSASIVPVDLQPDGSLAAPENFSLAGWYTGATVPGEPGPSVIVGHVDSYRGPAVFFRLHELVPGQPIVITTTDNTTRTFIVERLGQYSREHFPTAEVYGSTSLRALRLITCGGQFDPVARSYRDNIVVFARLAE